MCHNRRTREKSPGAQKHTKEDVLTSDAATQLPPEATLGVCLTHTHTHNLESGEPFGSHPLSRLPRLRNKAGMGWGSRALNFWSVSGLLFPFVYSASLVGSPVPVADLLSLSPIERHPGRVSRFTRQHYLKNNHTNKLYYFLCTLKPQKCLLKLIHQSLYFFSFNTIGIFWCISFGGTL